MLLPIISVLASIALGLASPVSVHIQSVTVVGDYNSTTGVDKFLGLKYGTAERFRRATPQSYSTTLTINATAFGPACPQIKGTNALAVNYGIYGTDEDCTLLDIYKPHTIPAGQLLPVMVWFHGGALTQGAASYYPGAGMVEESSKINLPVITVILNYRLAAWGFLGGSEAAANGALNLGLYDQKLALEWVQSHIGFFGGDKGKVTVFGQSSGAMSIGYHMLNVNTKLFRGAILQSGTTTSVPAIAPEKYQGNYNALVAAIGCNTSPDTFECLRTTDRDVLINATNAMFGQPTLYGSRPWGVSIDGEIIPGSPSVLTAQGKIANIPFITGNVRDEGTIFVKPQAINTTSDLLTFLEKDYLNRNATLFQDDTNTLILQLLYPNIPSLGSPFGTGQTTFFGPQFKRAAAIYGDIHFQWARRNFLTIATRKGIKSWSYLFNQLTPGNAPWQGVFHTGEIPYVFMKFSPSDGDLYALSRQMLAYWVSFAHNLDPNYSGSPKWERYSQLHRNIEFTAAKSSLEFDIFRILGIEFINSISHQLLQAQS